MHTHTHSFVDHTTSPLHAKYTLTHMHTRTRSTCDVVGLGVAGGMNEDGSFIGQYGEKTEKQQPDPQFATLV